MNRTSVKQTALIDVYGCNKYQLADKMRNNFHIPDEYLGALLKYKVIHISGKQFTFELFDGIIEDCGDKYAVIYNGCTPYHTKRAVEVRLSFRAAKPEFGIEPIVLVQIVDMGAPE